MLLYRNCYTKIEIIFTKDGLVWLGAPCQRLDSGQTFQVLDKLLFVYNEWYQREYQHHKFKI